jgi:hypothetical protein
VQTNPDEIEEIFSCKIKNTTKFGEVFLEFSEDITNMSNEVLFNLMNLTIDPFVETDDQLEYSWEVES